MNTLSHWSDTCNHCVIVSCLLKSPRGGSFSQFYRKRRCNTLSHNPRLAISSDKFDSRWFQMLSWLKFILNFTLNAVLFPAIRLG